MKAEVRVYHTDQGNLFGAVAVEQYRTMTLARAAVADWTTLGFIAIPVRSGRTDALKARRPPGWGKVQAAKVLVDRSLTQGSEARRARREKAKQRVLEARLDQQSPTPQAIDESGGKHE